MRPDYPHTVHCRAECMASDGTFLMFVEWRATSEVLAQFPFYGLQEKTPMKGSRGSAHIVAKCKMCSRENTLGRTA